ncbi:Myo-inositol-hexaphosphate 3-phosphohydrolase A [Hyphodiscus hymeniophilus]|uniref:Phytase A n=1 Tax=Hyphodiscus hymeniophilus TaxID=353542 RepID=A0A9P6VK26_9HELO|nr:Myo-inositol-hexaphosphate 3-phosphohydrolase A [Hyphodiscus hymeniophilus]
MAFGIVGVILFLYWAVILDTRPATQSCDTARNGYTCSPSISRYWGQYSPYFSVESVISASVPAQCQITFVQILSRHGARDPTSSKTKKYNTTINSIHSSVSSYGKGYEFIKDYEYTLGADQLTTFGQQEMVNSGSKFYDRYQALTRHLTPFVRSSGQARVVESAQNWTRGFHDARKDDMPSNPDSTYPYPIVVISEHTGSNNTLDHGLCTSFEVGFDSTIANSAQVTWATIFTPPITARLNKNLPGANLTLIETITMMDLCPFNTVASSIGSVSEFCDLFTPDEWESYDYYQSLGKYYGYSWGNPLGSTQGVGFTNELIARLTDTPVNDHTSTNHTLDSSPTTFPLTKNATLYADFSHDNDMMGIFSALGLYNETRPLLNTTRESTSMTDGFSASWLVPFAARAYFEKMTCVAKTEELVRVIVNDRVIPLITCGADKLGRCGLSAFVESLSFARAGGDWEQCFV